MLHAQRNVLIRALTRWTLLTDELHSMHSSNLGLSLRVTVLSNALSLPHHSPSLSFCVPTASWVFSAITLSLSAVIAVYSYLQSPISAQVMLSLDCQLGCPVSFLVIRRRHFWLCLRESWAWPWGPGPFLSGFPHSTSWWPWCEQLCSHPSPCLRMFVSWNQLTIDWEL